MSAVTGCLATPFTDDLTKAITKKIINNHNSIIFIRTHKLVNYL